MTDLPRTPAQIEAYVHVLGVEGTIAFLLEFGGAELALSRNPRADSRVAQAVGLDLARALGAHAGHLPRRVPLAKPWIAQVLRAQGLPVAEIARRLHVSDVAVRGYLRRNLYGKRRAPDPRQYSLL